MSHQEEAKVIHTTGRNNCGGRCVIHAHVRDGRIEKLTTDTAAEAGCGAPLTACVRGMNYHRTFLGEDRLRYPMKRTGERGEGSFKRITWQEAVDTIASEWIRIRDTYGPGSRYVNYATGISALMRGNTLAKRLLSLDGGVSGFLQFLQHGLHPSGHQPYVRNQPDRQQFRRLAEHQPDHPVGAQPGGDQV